MKSWIRRSLIGLVGLFGATAVIGGVSACSHRFGGDWHTMSEEDGARMRARFVEHAASRLELDEAQKQKLGVVADRLREQRAALLAGSDPRAQVRALVSGPAFDRAGAQALIEAKTDAIRAKSPEVVAAFGDFYDGLRPEQQQKLREMLNRTRH
jgi:periplasmic protein CpxP/Spy